MELLLLFGLIFGLACGGRWLRGFIVTEPIPKWAKWGFLISLAVVVVCIQP